MSAILWYRRDLREPWTMPADVQRGAGCVIGSDYPAPIVDHAEARRAALDRYRVAGGRR
jgi:deoxyribodipyrimidine photolyase